MAEDALVKEPLTDAMIDAGEELVRQLDIMGVPVTAALWLYDPEINAWKLRFSAADMQTKGMMPLFQKVGEAERKLNAPARRLVMMAIGALAPNSPDLRCLRKEFAPIPGISRFYFSHGAIDGHYIEDALIYRLLP